jgi:DNA-binding HxlR family transcriptional regulator
MPENLTELSEQLLRTHAQRPNQLFYGVDVLGGLFRDTDLARLDETYNELARAGLMERSGSVVSYFGMPKTLYRITEKGIEHVAREPAV